MLKRIIALVVKELLAVWQDKKSRAVLIFPPLLQLFIFSAAVTLDVKNINIGILNEDNGKYSYELIQRFQGSPTFKEIVYLQNDQQIEHAIDTQQVLMVLRLDAQFSRNILAGIPSQAQLILDGRKSNSSQIAQGYVSRIVDQYNLDIAQELNHPLPSTILVPRNWFNPNLYYTWFTVPSLVALLTMVTCLIITALSVARERELGTVEQLLVSPLLPFDILIGKAIPGMIIGMIEGTVILVAGIFIFGIPFAGSLLLLYLSMFVFVCSIVGIGLFISSLCKTQQQALLGVFVFMSPAVTLSGFATPIENMPTWLQPLTLADPLRHFLVVVRGLFLKDMSFVDVCANTYHMAIIALFTLAISSWFFQKRMN